METIIAAFDASLSNDDDETRQQATDFLTDEVSCNLNYITDLKNIYMTQENVRYKKYSLIMIKNMVTKCFEGIQENIQEFCEIIMELIDYSLNSLDIDSYFNYFSHLAAIIYQFSLNFTKETKEIWEGFGNFLVLYQEEKKVIPFCIYLYLLSCRKYNSGENDIYSGYRTLADEINQEITLFGLKCDYFETQLYSINLLSKIFKNVDEDIFKNYQEHFDLICQIAANSLEINKNDAHGFYLLWSLLYKFDIKISEPLFDTACSIIVDENLNPKNQCILFQFIIRRNELMSEKLSLEDIEKLVTGFFENQYEIAEIDPDEVECSGLIFANLIKIDEEGSYELFKRIIYEYLQSDDQNAQYVSLCSLPNFFLVFQKAAVNDISKVLPIAINAATGSENHLKKALHFIEYFLHFDKINLADSTLIIDFIITVISECTEDNIQYRALNVCKNLTINSVFFEKMISLYENIENESLAAYFSILLYFYRVENKINMVKYEPFLAFLIGKFNEFSKIVAELNEAAEQDCTNDEVLINLHRHTLVQCSAANLIIYLGFYSPIQLGEYVKPAFESIMVIMEDRYDLRDKDKFESDLYLDKEQMSFSDYNTFGLKDVKDDFTFVVINLKDPLISQFTEEYFEIVKESIDTESLTHFLCSYLDEDIGCSENQIEYFNEEFEIIKKKTSLSSIISLFMEVVFPMSKWIYKINDIELHKKYLKFIHNLINPKIITFDIYNIISIILLRIVKPKRIEYNSQNPFYNQSVIKVVEVLATKMVNIIQEVTSVSFNRYFEGFSNITLLFAYLKNDKGHEFLNSFLIPFYKENQETTETQMLELFSKLINLEYYNDDEIKEMVGIADGICKRGKIYHEIDSSLFNLITDMSKIHPEISPLFIEVAIATLNEYGDDEAHVDLIASCARFLLSAFNQNHEEFRDKIWAVLPAVLAVFPIAEKHKTLLFWLEIKSFFESCGDLITREIFESLLGCLTRYLSYQRFTNLIFTVPNEEHSEIIQFYSHLIESYLPQTGLSFEDLLNTLLPYQPTSVEFILSLYSS